MGIWYLFAISFLCLSMDYCCGYLAERHNSIKSVAKLNERFAMVVFIILATLTMFRDVHIGNDTDVYIWVYSNVCNGIKQGEFLRFEFGYQQLNILLSVFFKNPQAILIATGFICYVLIGLHMIKHVDNKLLYVVLFYTLLFSHYTNIIRQAIALSILIFAYEYCCKKKYVITVVLTLVAMLFHYAAIVFLAYVALKKVKLTPKSASFLFLMAVIFSLFADRFLLKWFIKLIPSYEYYLTGERVGTGQLGTVLNLLIVLVLFLLYYLPRKQHKISNEILWLFLLCGGLTALSFIMNNFTRVAYVFYLPIIKECCAYPTVYKKKNGIIELVAMGVLITIFTLILIFRPEWNFLYPYSFYSA